MKRPIGITIIAMIQIIAGGLRFLGALHVIGNYGPYVAFYALVHLILGLTLLILGIGMWNMKKWAWLGTIIAEAMVVLTLIGPAADVNRVGGLFFAVVTISYLLMRNVRKSFKQ